MMFQLGQIVFHKGKRCEVVATGKSKAVVAERIADGKPFGKFKVVPRKYTQVADNTFQTEPGFQFTL